MTTPITGLPLVYRQDKAHLWVEDALTKEYLIEIWQDSGIEIHIGGGNPTIRAVAEEASKQKFPNVLGLVDRDYEPSNYAQWENPASGARVLTLPVHEMENYLLDETALAGCSLNSQKRSIDDIRGRLRHQAGLYEWHTAVCCVLAEWRRLFNSDFPRHPARDLTTDQTTAMTYLKKEPWFVQLASRTTQATAAGNLDTALAAAHTKVIEWLKNGQWRQEFCGKEIFRDIRGYIYSPPTDSVANSRDIDVAKSVAEWQRSNNKIPKEISELQKVVHIKAGI